MKILYLRLLYFSGIYSGSGLTKFELDLTKSENRILMFNGGNGSGKSTVQSTLHPFADTLDGRIPIMKGKKGEKEIVIRNEDGNVYKINHYWTPSKTSFTVKSYIKQLNEDGTYEDLNPNGNVTSFKDKIKEIFDVDESYFKLLRIGSDVTNFIDLGTSQRKKFITNFLPDIEPYLVAYKKTTEKWSMLKKSVSTITDQIQKLDTKEHLEELKEQLEQQIEDLNKEISKAHKIDGKITQNLDTLDPDKDLSIIFNDAKSKYNQLAKKLNDIEKGEDLETLNESLNYHNQLVEKSTNKLELLQSSYVNDKTKLQKIINDKEEKQVKLNKYDSNESLNDCREMLKEYDKQIEEYEEQMEEFKDISQYSFDLSTIQTMQKFYVKSISERDKLKSSTDRSIIDLIADGNYMSLINSLDKTKEELEYMKEEIISFTMELEKLNERKSYSEIIKKRPTNCKIDSCPFIKDALKYSNVGTEIDNLEKEIKTKKMNYKIKSKNMIKSEKIYECINELKTIYNSIAMKEELSTIKGLESFSTFDSYVSNLNKIYDSSFFENFIELAQVREILKDIKDSKKPILIKKIENLEDKEEIINFLTTSIGEMNKEIDEFKDKIKEQKEEIDKTQTIISSSSTTISSLSEKIKLMEDRDLLETEFKNLEEKIKEYETKLSSIDELKTKYVRVQKYRKNKELELNPKLKELDRVKYNIKRLIDLEENKVKLEEEYGKVNILREALSPTKGIPVILTKAYLQPIKRIANELLDEAFKGKFYITDFIITDKDFFIQVKKEDGQLVNDICDASQGEKALVTISISLALLERIGTKYNIPLFDEIDATLDKSNRQAFLDILNKQLDKLGVVQTSVISHNNSFDTSPVDLVLFKDSTVDITDKSFMSNKKILLNIN